MTSRNAGWIAAMCGLLLLPGAVAAQGIGNAGFPKSGGSGAAKSRPAGGQRQVLDRLSRMTLTERQEALGKLPPSKQRQIEDRLDRYRQLSPEERTKLAERYDNFSQLPAERQDQLRGVFREFRSLAPERRTVLRQEMDRLRRMPEQGRQARLRGPEFRRKYDPTERRLLDELSRPSATPD